MYIDKLETKDLIIKKGEFSDWRDMYYNVWSDTELAKKMSWDVTTSKEDAKARMERTIAYESKHPYEWMVYEKSSKQAIGFVGLQQLEESVWGETKIVLGPNFIGKGYGKQILNALLDLSKEQFGAKKFRYCHRSDNEASRRLCQSCGFVYSHSEKRVDEGNGKMYTLEYNFKEL